MFLLYTNKVHEYGENDSNTLLFVADVNVYRQIVTPDDTSTLQLDQNSLLQWEAEWGMPFLSKKCGRNVSVQVSL